MYCFGAISGGYGCGLEIPARNFNVLMLGENVIGDVVDWYAIDCDKHAPGSLPKGAYEVNNILDCGWVGINVTSG